jgi:6-phosphogluconolactonase
MKPDVRVFSDAHELSVRAAEATVGVINEAVRATGRCSLVLSGGHTPRTLYGLLASQFRERLPWEHVHVFWGDERYVPAGDPQSNYRMAKEALLDHVPCPVTNIHPMPTHFTSADLAARDYEATLRNHFLTDWPRFDLVLLGLGDDGHTASLFPGSPALAERTRWVVAVQQPAVKPPLRLTLTLPAITRAAAVFFLVAGSSKTSALHHTLAGTSDWRVYPAAAVRPEQGQVVWWVDSEAAAPHTTGATHDEMRSRD